MLNIKCLNNKIENINKEISLLKDRFKINEESKIQFKDVLMRIKRLRLKQGQRTNLLKPKKYKKCLRIYSKIRLRISKKKMIY